MGPKDTGLTSVGITAARARVLHQLRSRRDPWGIPELSEVLGLHRNTVREHLSALVDDGLAEHARSRPTGPGRPPHQYRATTLGGGIDYLEFVSTLSDSIGELPQAADFIDRVGQSWGERLAEQLSTTHPDLVDALNELGFGPARLADGAIELGTCPVLAAARRNPEVICGIHRAMMVALARPGHGEVAVELEPWASPTGCMVRLQPVADQVTACQGEPAG